MRNSLVALLPVVLSLSSFVIAYEVHTLQAKELLEESYFEKLERRELLSEFTTRKLLAELVERAPKGGGGGSKTYSCPYCSKSYGSATEASACARTHNVPINSRKK